MEKSPSVETPSRHSGEPLVKERRVDSDRPGDVRLLRALILIGFAALLGYCGWWIRAYPPHPLWVALPLGLASLYLFVQVAGSWIVYFNALRPPKAPGASDGITVDVFIAAYNEPIDMVERALSAAVAMRGPHRTWLLDDGANPEFQVLAQRLGAGYLTRTDRRNAKAGNINAALNRTAGDVIAVFDIDHIPAPEFLEETVGQFSDPSIGFVQVMLTFSNQNDHWVAQAAAESCLDFYNPTSIGMEQLGGATMMGSNSLLRRTALASIEGYQPGLAEDLATSIALHAAGWRSVYVAKPLAPGQVPPDLAAWFTQQMKWSRGVFELLLTAYPRFWSRLTAAQRLCYAVRMTKYLIGPFVAVHLALTLLVLASHDAAALRFFQGYLLALSPVVLMDVLIRNSALAAWSPPNEISTSVRRAVALVYATFPIYTAAWLMALLRLPLSFRPTPKTSQEGLRSIQRLPLILILLLLGVALAYGLCCRHSSAVVLVFAVMQTIPILVLLSQSSLGRQRQGRRKPETDPSAQTGAYE